LDSKVRIHVHPNGDVEVETPSDKSLADIKKAIYKRANWISNRLDEALAVRENVLPREYVSGETHFYLGRRYQLKITETSERHSSVKLKGGLLNIELPIADKSAVKRRLNAWYKERAKSYLGNRVVDVSTTIPWVKRDLNIKFVKMQKQWGSCSPTGVINLNPWLIRAPRDCIDYVIIHEVCHLVEHNHSKHFYDLLDSQLPNWKHTKARLDGMAELILAE
ncbi:MAG: M48 family metallopeptidase, partial [Cohaesibacter sp.]|nr:M48 family metallopeptidase [Cohaesibacter sp.]